MHVSKMESGGHIIMAASVLASTTDCLRHESPPSYSRLPPDGHEFPPNFREQLEVPNNSLSKCNNETTIALGTISQNNNPKGIHSKIEKICKETIVGNEHISCASNSVQNESILQFNVATDVESAPPPLPTSGPPALVIRGLYTKDSIQSEVDGKPSIISSVKAEVSSPNDGRYYRSSRSLAISSNNSTATPIESKRSAGVPRHHNHWCKDAKSEKSIRDKIAMFSNEDITSTKYTKPLIFHRFTNGSKPLNLSTENLLRSKESSCDRLKMDNNLSKTRAISVENLKNGSWHSQPVKQVSTQIYSDLLHSLNILKENPTQIYASLPRRHTSQQQLERRPSFSGSLAFVANEANRKAAITNILDQRRKSLSKLRGLVIPERPHMHTSTLKPILDLPEIKNRDNEKVKNLDNISSIDSTESRVSSITNFAVMPGPSQLSELNTKFPINNINSYSPLRSLKVLTINNTANIVANNLPHNHNSLNTIINNRLPVATQRRLETLNAIPHVKPPRTPLAVPLQLLYEESDSCDSVFSSRISSPSISSYISHATEKFVLTRTLSSETNTSITSSITYTLTSASGSQASYSSVDCTPTVDLSRSIAKSSSNDSTSNRKNILASAKCRNGRGDTSLLLRNQLYDDEDNTDGDDEDEIRGVHKSKYRSFLSNSVLAAASKSGQSIAQTNYKTMAKLDQNLIDKVINVTAYVEVASDTDDSNRKFADSYFCQKLSAMFIDEERKNWFKANCNQKARTKSEAAYYHIDQNKSNAAISTAPIQVNNSSSTIETVPTVEKKSNCEFSELSQWMHVEVAKYKVLKRSLESSPKPLLKKFEKSKSATSTQYINVISKASSSKISTAEIREKFEQTVTIAAPVTGLTTFSSKTTILPVSSTNTNSNTTISESNNVMFNINCNSNANCHERFNSMDSTTSSSYGCSSTTQNISSNQDNITKFGSFLSLANQDNITKFGSFLSLASNQNLITVKDIQLIIEEANPPLKTPEAFIIVLQRDTPESSIGITLGGGSDYEAKEITIHKILANTPAAKDNRLKKGDRILAVNGMSMRGLTHRESITVLKNPRHEVVLLVTRSESVIIKSLAKKHSSLSSQTSLTGKPFEIDYERKRNYYKASKSLDLDLDIIFSEDGDIASSTNCTTTSSASSNDRSMNSNYNRYSSTTMNLHPENVQHVDNSRLYHKFSCFDASKISTNQLLKRAQATGHILPEVVTSTTSGVRTVEIIKGNCGLGFSIEGGFDSPLGNRPLIVKKVFMGGAAHKTNKIKNGDEILNINGASTAKMTRVDAWNYMKQLPLGPVKIVFT